MTDAPRTPAGGRRPQGLGRARRATAALAATAAAASLAGCAARIGPDTVIEDRADYSRAITDSQQQQMLGNIVRIRYADAPSWLEVSSIVNSYELRRQATARASLSLSEDTASVGADATYVLSDRPTISYQPLTGAKFTQSLLKPLPPTMLVSLMRAGWPVDDLFRICASSVNGVRAASHLPVFGQQDDANFARLLKDLRALQLTGSIDLRMRKGKEGTESLFMIVPDPSASTLERLRRVRESLSLAPLPSGNEGYLLTYAPLARSDQELAILTRSVYEILAELSMQVEMPEGDLEDGRVQAPPGGAPAYFRVHSGTERPDDAFVTYRHRGRWYWIEDTDFQSKRVFRFVQLLLRLSESGSAPGAAPILTIPAG